LIGRAVIIERSEKLFVRGRTILGKCLNKVGVIADSGFLGSYAEKATVDHEN
jgi:hypothetical protein